MKQTQITKSAQGESCTVRIAGCRNDTTTTVLAHINSIRHGHGIGKKNNDIHGAYCCHYCHEILDGRAKHNFERDYLKLAHLEGVLETQLKLIDKGLLK